MKKFWTRRLLPLLLAALLLTVGAPALAANTQWEADDLEMLRQVNAQRHQQGLEGLSIFPLLNQATDARAAELPQLFSHTRPDGSSCFTVLEEYGVSYGTAGENIAAGYADVDSVMTGWMNSDGHRANILGAKFSHLGVGKLLTGSGYRTYWAQLFIGGCQVSGIALDDPQTRRTLQAGETIQSLGELVHVTCSHGESVLPLTDALCRGFDPDSPGAQTVTVNYRGASLRFSVQVLGDAPLVGDVNGDGKIAVYDALLALQIAVGGDATAAQRRAADVNGDGQVTTIEALEILRRATQA